eukprot:1816590-Rhodomonas_salina.1
MAASGTSTPSKTGSPEPSGRSIRGVSPALCVGRYCLCFVGTAVVPDFVPARSMPFSTRSSSPPGHNIADFSTRHRLGNAVGPSGAGTVMSPMSSAHVPTPAS